MRIRFYYNGKLKPATGHTYPTVDRARIILGRIQDTWSQNIMPMVQPGEFDPNNASEVTRLSQDELHVTTTGGHKLRWSIVE